MLLNYIFWPLTFGILVSRSCKQAYVQMFLSFPAIFADTSDTFKHRCDVFPSSNDEALMTRSHIHTRPHGSYSLIVFTSGTSGWISYGQMLNGVSRCNLKLCMNQLFNASMIWQCSILGAPNNAPQQVHAELRALRKMFKS